MTLPSIKEKYAHASCVFFFLKLADWIVKAWSFGFSNS